MAKDELRVVIAVDLFDRSLEYRCVDIAETLDFRDREAAVDQALFDGCNFCRGHSTESGFEFAFDIIDGCTAMQFLY